MNRELVTKWVKALESGKYKQGEGSFHDVIKNSHGDGIGDTYCCLGVADLVCFGRTHDPGEKGLFNLSDEYGDQEDIDHAQSLGLNEELQDKLANMNDGSTGTGEVKRTFKYIAKYIRKNILGEKVRVR